MAALGNKIPKNRHILPERLFGLGGTPGQTFGSLKIFLVVVVSSPGHHVANDSVVDVTNREELPRRHVGGDVLDALHRPDSTGLVEDSHSACPSEKGKFTIWRTKKE